MDLWIDKLLFGELWISILGYIEGKQRRCIFEHGIVDRGIKETNKDDGFDRE